MTVNFTLIGKPKTADFMKNPFSYRGLLHGMIYPTMLSMATMNSTQEVSKP